MPLTLTQSQAVSATVDAYEITSFAVDLERFEIHVGYKRLAGGAAVDEQLITIDGPEFSAAIGEASTIAGADVYSALKQALYNQITAQTGAAGTVA